MSKLPRDTTVPKSQKRRDAWPTHAQVVYLQRLSAETSNRRWLEVGCGRRFVPSWMPGYQSLGRAMIRDASHAVGLDPCPQSLSDNDGFEHKVCCGVESMPFEDASFDLVTANMVAEHLAAPGDALREIHRVLSIDGRFIFHTPNYAYPLTRLSSWLPDRLKIAAAKRLEKREAPDVFPTFYRLNQVKRIRRLGEAAGFSHVQVDAIDSVPMLWAAPRLSHIECSMMHLLNGLGFRNLRANLIVTMRK